MPCLVPTSFSGAKEESQCRCPTSPEVRGEEVGAVGVFTVGYREGCRWKTNCTVTTKGTGLKRKKAARPLNYYIIY